MFSKRSITAVVALGIGGVAAVAVPAGVAVGQSSAPSSSIIIKGTGVIKDGGAVAFVKVLVACPAGESDGVQLDLTERSGGGIASGFGNAYFNCSGQIQTLTLAVQPQTKPFLKGNAYASAEEFDSNGQTSRTVALAPPK